MKWETEKIGNLCRIKHGFAFKGEFFTDSGEFVLLTPGNFNETGGLKLKGDKEKYYSGEIPKDFVLDEDDLLIVLTDLIQNAPILGGAAFVPESNKFLHNQRLGKIEKLNHSRIDEGFFYYCLNNQSYRGQVRGSATGATVRHTAPERIYNCTIPLPPLPTQQKIASILSAYDDLIENNLKRIRLLEEAAQHLYREWFVRFRFPGWEEVKMVEGLPEGWERKKLGEVVMTVVRGISPKYVESEGFTVINQKCIRNKTLSYEDARLTSDASSISEEKILRQFDILVNSTGLGTLGRVAQVLAIDFKQTVDSHVTIVRAEPNTISPLLLGYEIKSQEQFISGLGKGSTNQTELSRNDLKDLILVIVPPKEYQKQFEEIVKTILFQIHNLQKQNHRLKAARDLLLPRLMSGVLEV